jgi:hypothetical protein
MGREIMVPEDPQDLSARARELVNPVAQGATRIGS